jgi:hypothetical protein
MRNFNVIIYLVKAAELDVIRRTARNLLRGLPFTTIYTPHFAMCTDNLSEILLATAAEQVETKSVMRFCCSGLYPKAELNATRLRMNDHCSHFPETVGLWKELEPEYFDRAAAKANLSLQKTLKELGRKPGSSFTIMIINNDTLPLFELLASKEYNQLEIARPGDVIQFRYEVAECSRRIMSWQLVHAYHYR